MKTLRGLLAVAAVAAFSVLGVGVAEGGGYGAGGHVGAFRAGFHVRPVVGYSYYSYSTPANFTAAPLTGGCSYNYAQSQILGALQGDATGCQQPAPPPAAPDQGAALPPSGLGLAVREVYRETAPVSGVAYGYYSGGANLAAGYGTQAFVLRDTAARHVRGVRGAAFTQGGYTGPVGVDQLTVETRRRGLLGRRQQTTVTRQSGAGGAALQAQPAAVNVKFPGGSVKVR